MVQILRFLVPLWLALILFTPAQAQVRKRDDKPRTASISGRVLVNGKPAINAPVTAIEINLRPQIGVSPIGEVESYKTVTDGEGHYQLLNLAAGSYEVQALSNAFVPDNQAGDTGFSQIVKIDMAEVRKDVNFALVRGGVISGRVTEDGRPVIDRRIQLQRVDEKIQRAQSGIYPASWEMYETDDRGVYRIYGLRAGRYLVSAEGDPAFGSLSNSGVSPRTWYPSVTELGQATTVEVEINSEVENIDINLGAKKKTYEVTGRVIDAETGKPVPKINVTCNATGGSDSWTVNPGNSGVTNADGNFRLTGLLPAKYSVSVSALIPLFEQNEYYSRENTFEIINEDLSNVEIKAYRGATISGVAVIEEVTDPAIKSTLSQLMLTAAVFQFPDYNRIGMPVMSKIGADGKFILTGLPPGIVMLELFNVGHGQLLLDRIERDGAVIREGVKVSGPEQITGVRVIFTRGTSVISGEVKVSGGEVPKDWHIMVMANRKSGESTNPKSTEIDKQGHFKLEGLLHGEYEISLVARIELDRHTTLSRESPPTQRVTVARGAEAQVTLTLDLSKMGKEDRQ